MLSHPRVTTLLALAVAAWPIASTAQPQPWGPSAPGPGMPGLGGPEPFALEARTRSMRLKGEGRAQDSRLTIRGRVDKQEVGAFDGLRISVYRIDRDGRLTPVSEHAVRADANGRYEIALPARLEGERDLVIEAIHPAVKGSGLAIVPTFGSVSNTLIAPTIDLKSAVESEIFLEISSERGEAPIRLNALRSLITRRLAAGLRASTSYEEEISLVAHAAIGAARAWQLALQRPELGLASEQIEIASSTLDWAQVMLDAELYAAESAQQKQKAEAEHQDIVAAAYASAGIGPEHLAAAAQAAADTMRLYAQGIGGKTRAILISEAESLRAKYVTNAIESLFYAVGAPVEERRAVRNAGERLEGKIISAGESPEDVDTTLHKAWNEYQKSVLLRLKTLVAKEQPERTI